MNEEAQYIIEEMKENMLHALTYLDREFQKIRAGKATPQMLEGVRVDYYGTLTPIEQISNINTPDARQIIVQPFEKPMLGPIDKAILAANLGFNPQSNGEILRITVPALSEERRKDMVKRAKHEAENARVTVRNIRRAVIDDCKKLEKDGMPEDDVKVLEKDVQHITDQFIVKVDKMLEAKEKDIMTV
ncbi:MAG: ribosome recycling factor [Bacteroidales bacterium]